jgi:2-polyprenyl-6-methoxyphenol hydroxylase-like FAD-dependent oxidoreductase
MRRIVTILGGGLAGLALGLGLRRRDVPVELHEAGDYPRHRVCGEFIAGLDDTTAELLALGPHLADARRLQGIAWFTRGRCAGGQTLPTPAFGLSRHALDTRLAEALRAAGGAVFTRSRLTSPRPLPAGLVCAAGRRPATRSRWMGLKRHVRNLPLAADLELHLGRQAYVGLSGVEGGVVNVCGLFDRIAVNGTAGDDRFVAALHASGLPELARRVAAAAPVPGSDCAVAALAFAVRPHATTEPVTAIAVGDRLGMIPPFTGDGMAMAFQSAACAVGPLADWAAGTTDWATCAAAVRQAQVRRFRRRFAAAAGLHPFLLQRGPQALFAWLSRNGWLPFRPLFHLLH